jgi:uncharacterized protein (TIGR00369 family)
MAIRALRHNLGVPEESIRGGMPIMSFLDIEIDPPTEDGIYTALLKASPNTLNSNGVVHGAAIAALVDHAGGYGVQKLIAKRGVTSDLHIRFLAAARSGSVLRAEARVVRDGRTQIVVDVRVTDNGGRIIAVADMALAVVDGQGPTSVSTAGSPGTA